MKIGLIPVNLTYPNAEMIVELSAAMGEPNPVDGLEKLHDEVLSRLG